MRGTLHRESLELEEKELQISRRIYEVGGIKIKGLVVLLCLV